MDITDILKPFLILLAEVSLFAIINSIASAGIVEMIHTIIDNDPDDDQSPKIHRFVKLIIVFIVAGILCLYLENIQSIWQRIGIWIFIASTSILIYKVVVKSFMESIPVIMSAITEFVKNKISGGPK